MQLYKYILFSSSVRNSQLPCPLIIGLLRYYLPPTRTSPLNYNPFHGSKDTFAGLRVVSSLSFTPPLLRHLPPRLVRHKNAVLNRTLPSRITRSREMR